MSLRAVAAVLSILIAPVLHASRRIIPIAGHTNGVNGSVWTTEIALTNESATTQLVQIEYPDFEVRNVSLAAGESRRIADDGSRDWLGQVEVNADDAVAISALVVGSMTAGVLPILDDASLADRGIVPGLIATRKFRTNVALVSAGDDWTTFTLRFRGPEGVLAAETPVAVAPHQTLQLPATVFVPAIGLYGLEWSADHPAYVCASVIDNISGDPTIVPTIAAARDSFVPVAGRVEGALGTTWSTSFLATSYADIEGMITFELYDGEAKPRTFGMSIAPRGTLQISDVCERAGVERGMGYLVIRSTVELAAYTRVFHTAPDSGTFGSLVAPQTRPGSVDLLRIVGIRRDPEHRLNVLIANAGAFPVVGEIVVDGDSTAFHVDAQSVVQYAIASDATIEAGAVEVHPASPGEIAAVASVVENRNGDTVVFASCDRSHTPR